MENKSILQGQFPGNFGQQLNNIPLTRRVAEQLRSLILDGTLKPGTRLPSEPELAGYLKISRVSLRGGLDALEHQGFIIRKRGMGTFIANKPVITNNLNVNNGVTQLIRSIGAIPGTSEIHTIQRDANLREMERLHIERGTSVLSIERVRTADGKPVVVTLDYIPASLLSDSSHTYSIKELEKYLLEEQSIYLFLSDRLKINVHHAITWIRPVTADKITSDRLQIPVGGNILYSEQVDYDAAETPLVLSDEFYASEVFTFAVYRAF